MPQALACRQLQSASDALLVITLQTLVLAIAQRVLLVPMPQALVCHLLQFAFRVRLARTTMALVQAAA